MMTAGQRTRVLDDLRAFASARGLSALVLVSGDVYCSDFPAEPDRTVMHLTGFSVGGAMLVVTAGSATAFAIQPFAEQAAREIDPALGVSYQASDVVPVADWLAARLPRGARVGLETERRSRTFLEAARARLELAGVSLEDVSGAEIDALTGRPAAQRAPIDLHPARWSGASCEEKRQRVAQELHRAGLSAMLVNGLSSVAWLFNIRGRDLGGPNVTSTPVCKARALVMADGRAALFCDLDKLPAGAAEHFGDGVTLHREHELHALARAMAGPSAVVGMAPRWMSDPIADLKAVKHAAEQDGAREAFLHASASLIEMLVEIYDDRDGPRALREFGVRRRLAELHARSPDYMMESFPAIVAGGPRAALLNYIPQPDNDHALADAPACLIDTGGQFRSGTTDITRTILYARSQQPELNGLYTLCLKAHIENLTTPFPAGATPYQLDAVWRAPLWRAQWEFYHGVGHGVGSCLDVHEAPIALNPRRPSLTPLQSGMVIAADSCLYKEGEFGLRIENVFLIQEAPSPSHAPAERWLRLDVLSLVPFDHDLIDWSALTAVERAWIAAYYARIQLEVGPRLGASARTWLAHMASDLEAA